ncbi:hypothetical protein [Pseudanabaena sp. 'Roaring Creek']|nr:hypothetical protein [Pseudanabaena sp. 'Roaring Creek']
MKSKGRQSKRQIAAARIIGLSKLLMASTPLSHQAIAQGTAI